VASSARIGNTVLRSGKRPQGWIGWLVAAGLCLGIVGHAPASESEQRPSEQAADIELKSVRQQIDRANRTSESIASELSALEKEHEDLSARLAETASRIQSREAMITAGEDRIGSLDGEEKALLDDLRRRREVLGDLLAGLQRMERNPPPPLATHPDDALAALRGAMLFGAVVPALRAETAALRQSLARLEDVREEQGSEQKEVAAHLARLAAERAELVALQARKQALIAETRGRLTEEQERARKLAEKARSLEQLLAGLTAARKVREEAEHKKAKTEEEKRIALLNRPRSPFSKLQGRLDYPAQGQRVRGFGDQDGFGSRSQGLFIATRPSAQVVAPADGKVEFAGHFRSYGLLLILNVGEGYHVLMAGLGAITAETGQATRAGEPVGLMGEQPASGTLIGDRLEDPRPILYIEFRKDGGAIDPSSWWVDSRREARG